MNQQLDSTAFFAMEAGEYLERLDTLVSGPVGPDRDELVRLVRALRGSALMANQQHIGGVAEALEGVARAIKEGRVGWDEATRQVVISAVDGLKILVRSVSTWGDSERSRANKITVELSALSGVSPRQPAAPSQPAVDKGTRAFVAREGAAVASVLDRTAKALQREGPSRSIIQTVIRSMEPLRGLAALSELPPIPEFLDGVERALDSTAPGGEKPNEIALFLDVAARGLSKAAQEISTVGAAEPESVEAREFTRRLAAILDIDAEIVPIQSLYYEDEGPHVLEAGSSPAMRGQLGQMEFVAHGEHLCQVADGLERAEWGTQREIRTISLKSTLRSLTAARGSSLASAVSAFADVTLRALAGGSLDHHAADFITRLRQAGTALGNATPVNEPAQVASLASITDAMRNLGVVEEVAKVEPEVPAGEPIAATTVAPPETEDIEDVAASWLTYERLLSELGDGETSIEVLVGAAEGEAAPPKAELISITELCYSGRAALDEAHLVRDRIRSQLAESDWNAVLITDLMDELLDLVELGVGQT